MSDSKPQPAPSATPDAAPVAQFDWSQSPFESFLEQHFKKLLIGLLAIGVGVGGWLVLRQQAERKAIAEAQAFTGSETLDDYKKVIANHPGTVAAGSAQLMIANLLAQNNDAAGAIEELKKFSAGYPTHPMADHAAFRSAVLAAEKDGAAAGVTQYDTFINQFPNSPFRALAQLRKADALVTSGKRDEAIAIYESIQKDNSLYANPVLAEAKERIAQVKLKPPVEVEFVPEPTPPPSAAAPAGTPPSGLDFEAPAPTETTPPTLSIDPTTPPPPAPAPGAEAPTAVPETPAPAPAPANGQ